MNSGQFPHRMREDFNQQKSGSYKIMLRIWRTEHLKLKSERFETSIIHNEERGLGDIDTKWTYWSQVESVLSPT